jgi:hydroxypyruvate reductase
LKRYQIDISNDVLTALQYSKWESPKQGDAAFHRSTVHLIATPQQSLMAAANWAESK